MFSITRVMLDTFGPLLSQNHFVKNSLYYVSFNKKANNKQPPSFSVGSWPIFHTISPCKAVLEEFEVTAVFFHFRILL